MIRDEDPYASLHTNCVIPKSVWLLRMPEKKRQPSFWSNSSMYRTDDSFLKMDSDTTAFIGSPRKMKDWHNLKPFRDRNAYRQIGAHTPTEAFARTHGARLPRRRRGCPAGCLAPSTSNAAPVRPCLPWAGVFDSVDAVGGWPALVADAGARRQAGLACNERARNQNRGILWERFLRTWAPKNLNFKTWRKP